MCNNCKPEKNCNNAGNNYSVDILGEKWDVIFCYKKDDPELNDCDGYTSTKNGERKIAIAKDAYQDKESIIRHELIHAFLFETGLGFCSNWATNEEMVDYFARNWTKIDNLMSSAIGDLLE